MPGGCRMSLNIAEVGGGAKEYDTVIIAVLPIAEELHRPRLLGRVEPVVVMSCVIISWACPQETTLRAGGHLLLAAGGA